MRALFRRVLCRLVYGHDPMLAWERDRLFLRCASCGYETTGWTIARAETLCDVLPTPAPSKHSC